MTVKLENGVYALGPGGRPEEISGLDELLQNAALRLTIPKGSFPYGREFGSRLDRLDRQEEHAAEQAVSLANEALLDLPGVSAESAELLETGELCFTLSTPLGKGRVVYGQL